MTIEKNGRKNGKEHFGVIQSDEVSASAAFLIRSCFYRGLFQFDLSHLAPSRKVQQMSDNGSGIRSMRKIKNKCREKHIDCQREKNKKTNKQKKMQRLKK